VEVLLVVGFLQTAANSWMQEWLNALFAVQPAGSFFALYLSDIRQIAINDRKNTRNN
jgi:hypothetical protein